MGSSVQEVSADGFGLCQFSHEIRFMRMSSVPLFCQPVRSGTELPSVCRRSAALHPVLCRFRLCSASAFRTFGQYFELTRCCDQAVCFPPVLTGLWLVLGSCCSHLLSRLGFPPLQSRSAAWKMF